MVLQERIDLLVELGAYLTSEDEFLSAIMHRVAYNNGWLTKENCLRAAEEIGKHCLHKEALLNWADQYNLPTSVDSKKVGLVIHGDGPFEGLLDMVAIFISGNHTLLKLSENDEYTLPHLIKMLQKWDPASQEYFKQVSFLKGFDAVITTKTEKENAYFEQYLGKYPNLIRTKRNSIAVLTGKETDAQLLGLGDDVFAYFGLTEANVSKLYLPIDYDLDHLLSIFHEYREIIRNTRYKNNFDYNYSLYLLNMEAFKANGCILLTENKLLQSRIACLHYEYYENLDQLNRSLQAQSSQLHFVISEEPRLSIKSKKLGASHQPSLFNYAGGADTMQFLKELVTD